MIGNMGYERRLQALERRAREVGYGIPAPISNFTPVVTQGVGINIVAGYTSVELLIGKFYIILFRLTMDSAGTPGNSIRLSGFSKSLEVAEMGSGSFKVFDTGTTNHAGTVDSISTTTLVFQVSGNGNLLGITPAYTIAAGDTLSGVYFNMVA